MLTLITGQPGNGKTLYTLGLVEELRTDPASLAIGREVYQSGIPELVLPWKDLADPKDWPKLPNGSIVVIDECQRIFPPRKQGAVVPPEVREFETHRHRGFDVYLITQHPQLLDIAVRKLVGRHYHLRRTFGQQTATLYQWERCASPEDRSDQAQALKTRFAFPKERFAWYKSADIHTVKKALPWKPIATLAGCIIGIGLLAWVAASRLGRLDDKAEEGPVMNAPLKLESGPGLQYTAESLEPAVAHWPWSAPFYREAVKIASVPRIVGCMSMLIDDVQTCRCHNGQGDANVSVAVCRDFIAGRVFDPTREVIDAKAENIRRLEAGSRGGSSEGQTDERPSRSERTSSS
jgi:hypothetical protein